MLFCFTVGSQVKVFQLWLLFCSCSVDNDDGDGDDGGSSGERGGSGSDRGGRRGGRTAVAAFMKLLYWI